ncbi:MAG: lipoprotein-releasing ABC transporter permease subunit [Myxococcota bacterium]
MSFLSVITLISTTGVALGVATLTVVLSVVNGFEKEYKERIVGATAHGVILKYGIDFSEHREVIAKAKKAKGVKSASPFVLGEVMISARKRTKGAVIKGIAAGEPEVSAELKKHIVSGDIEWLKNPEKIPLEKGTMGGTTVAKAPPTDAKDIFEQMESGGEESGSAKTGGFPAIILGVELAKNLDVSVGDTVHLVNPVKKGAFNPMGLTPKTQTMRVAGVFSAGYYEYDEKLAYVTLEDAQRFLDIDDTVSGIEVKVTNIEKASEIMKEVYAQIGGYPYRTRDWKQMNYNLFSALALYKMVMFIILIFIILVAAFNIVSTLYLFVTEKEKEISIMKSMGANDKMIAGIFTRIGVIVGVIGTVIGVALGLLLSLVIELYGYRLDPDIYLIDRLPVDPHPLDFIAVALAAICISFLATIIPSLIAARMRPAEGLRFD